MAHARRVPLRSGGEILHAVINELDRMAALHREQGGMCADRRWVVFFSPKSSACFRLNYAHLVFGEIEYRHERFVHIKRALQRSPDGDTVLFAVLGDSAVVLDVEVLLRSGAVFALYHVRSRRPY